MSDIMCECGFILPINKQLHYKSKKHIEGVEKMKQRLIELNKPLPIKRTYNKDIKCECGMELTSRYPLAIEYHLNTIRHKEIIEMRRFIESKNKTS